MSKLAWRLRFTRVMMQLTDCSILNAWKASGECADMFGYEFWRDVNPSSSAAVESQIYVSYKSEN